MIHESPHDKFIETAWGEHCPAWYTDGFFKKLQEINKYDEIRFSPTNRPSPEGDIGQAGNTGHTLVFYRKTSEHFMTKEEFPYDDINWKEGRGSCGDYS